MMRMEEIRRSASEFLYQLLGRLQSDCKYYLGNGGHYAGHLWARNEREHIETMRNIFRRLCEIGGAPEWITMEEIDEYAEQMLVV